MSEKIDQDMALKQAKAELRQRISAMLHALPQDSIRQQSSLVHSKLFALPEYQSAKTLGIFMSMPTGEVVTEPIVHHAFDQGKSVFIPYLRKNNNLSDGPKSVMDMVELKSREDFTQLVPDKWGIPSLRKDALHGRRICPVDLEDKDIITKLDLLVMPGVAFDVKLQRIGHGKGYYDFFLDRYKRHAAESKDSMPFLVAIALEQQLLPVEESVPTDHSDWPLEALITAQTVLRR